MELATESLRLCSSQKNIGTVDTHLADYQRMIDNLQVKLLTESATLFSCVKDCLRISASFFVQTEVCRLRKELAEKESQLSIKPVEKAADDELSWLNILSRETGENVQERINLQKALFELEETNLRNRTELQHLDDAIALQEVKIFNISFYLFIAFSIHSNKDMPQYFHYMFGNIFVIERGIKNVQLSHKTLDLEPVPISTLELSIELRFHLPHHKRIGFKVKN